MELLIFFGVQGVNGTCEFGVQRVNGFCASGEQFVMRYSGATLVVKGCNKKIFSSSWSTVEIFVPPEMPTKRVV